MIVSSRVSLSLLAGITGAALTYIAITFFNLPVHTDHTPYTRITVLVALVFVFWGWVSIFRRPRQDDE